ncbi:MAG: PilZ domain-containing protein [bacterium]|nr:PilZ domain-containing protein [bacterium]
MGKAADRRKYPRIATDQVISFAHVDNNDQLAIGRDVSTGGIRFEAVGCELDLGDTIRVTFNVGNQSIVAVGEVVWAIETDPITLDIGLEFRDIDPDSLRMIEETAEILPSI